MYSHPRFTNTVTLSTNTQTTVREGDILQSYLKTGLAVTTGYEIAAAKY
jgi:hypothetical protein